MKRKTARMKYYFDAFTFHVYPTINFNEIVEEECYWDLPEFIGKMLSRPFEVFDDLESDEPCNSNDQTEYQPEFSLTKLDYLSEGGKKFEGWLTLK